MEETQPSPKVTALIVSYNSARPLRRCLEALERTTPRALLEILVVDCGSQDESPTLDAQFPSVTILRLPRHFGATKALNIGVRTAKGEYIFFLDPEVEVQPETTGALAARLDSDEEATAVCPLLTDPDGELVSRIEPLPTPTSLATASRGGERPSPVSLQLDSASQDVAYPGRTALAARKRFIEGMNFLDSRYGEYWADAELCFQILRAQKKIRLLPNVRVTIHPREVELADLPSAARAVLAADCVLGAAEFIGKHYGFFAALKFRLAGIFWALGRAILGLLKMRDVGFEFGRLTALISGQKVDGSQGGL